MYIQKWKCMYKMQKWKCKHMQKWKCMYTCKSERVCTCKSGSVCIHAKVEVYEQNAKSEVVVVCATG